jgi:UDP-hydrolysing UDP-N-acetyl-D-glucosamine 2-epimerase
VYIVGDRYEMLPVAYAAVLQNIRVAHQMGGELSGTIDESVRHAITKLSHVHFAATEQSAERLRQMGEGNVHCTGCPRIDLAAQVAPEHGSYAMLSLHPVTTEDDGFAVASDALNGLLAAWPGVIHLFWPNADAGHAELMGAFKGLMGGRVQSHRNLPPERYMALLAGAAVCVGNSSSAIREGAYFGTPVVDVGSRQRAREVGPNVLRCTPEETFLAVGEQLRHGSYPRSTLYGDGKASERIARVLGAALPSVQKEWQEWRAIA